MCWVLLVYYAGEHICMCKCWLNVTCLLCQVKGNVFHLLGPLLTMLKSFLKVFVNCLYSLDLPRRTFKQLTYSDANRTYTHSYLCVILLSLKSIRNETCLLLKLYLPLWPCFNNDLIPTCISCTLIGIILSQYCALDCFYALIMNHNIHFIHNRWLFVCWIFRGFTMIVCVLAVWNYYGGPSLMFKAFEED